MKKFKFSPRINLQLAVCGLLLILGLLTYYAFSSVSNVETTQYIYIDEDDTQDSVIAKIQPFANLIGMTTLNTLIRHSGYSENIRTGRYAIEPGDGPITIFRRLRSGRQTSLNLTIPESRTMDRLAAILSNKLMVDQILSSVLIELVTVVEFRIERQLVGLLWIEGIDTRDEVVAALGERGVHLGLLETFHQENIRNGRLVGWEVHNHGLFRLERNLLGIIQVLDRDLHGIFSVFEREALLIDEGTADFRRVGYDGTVKGDLGVVANFVTLFKDGLHFHGRLVFTRLELVIDHT